MFQSMEDTTLHTQYHCYIIQMYNTNDDVPLVLAEKIIYGIIAGLGIIGNGLVIYVLAYAVNLRRGNTNILLINQSLIDLMASVMLVLCYLAPGIQKLQPSTPAARVFVCYIWNPKYLFWATTMTSNVNLLCLTFERYYATLHPFKYRNQPWLVWPRSLLLAAVPWMLGYLFQCSAFVRNYLDKKDRCKLMKFHSHTSKILYSVALLFFDYILPLALMVFAYISIYRQLRRVESMTTHDSPNEQTPIVQPTNRREELRNHHLRRNVIKTLITVCGVFGLLWLPNQFAYFYYTVNDNVQLNMQVYSVSICIAFLNMCVNPFIYTLQYHHFREGLQKAMPCLTKLRIMRLPRATNQLD